MFFLFLMILLNPDMSPIVFVLLQNRTKSFFFFFGLHVGSLNVDFAPKTLRKSVCLGKFKELCNLQVI